MGDFRLVIDAVGDHGTDRKKKNGETVDFSTAGQNSAEQVALKTIEDLKAKGFSINSAKIIHWPVDNQPGMRKEGDDITDDLITGVRTGEFKW